VFREAGFWKAFRLEWSVGRRMVYPVISIAECLTKSPAMCGQWSFCEKEKVSGVLVKHRNDVDQEGAASPRILDVNGKEFEFNPRCGGGRMLVRCESSGS
jgi:hypothetical protein